MKTSIPANLACMVILVLLQGCASNDLADLVIDCSQSTLSLSLSSSTDASGCNAADGTIVVMATGGKSPYTYAIGSTSNATGSFEGLALGSYEVTVFDADMCLRALDVEILASGASLNMEFVVTQDSECLTNNGSIEATATGGTPPYEFRINDLAFGSTALFDKLSPNSYVVEVRDDQGCVFTKIASVPRGNTGISFSAQIKPIIDTKCALSGCHNGDNGAERNWTVFTNVKTNAANIKTRTGNGSMPAIGSLTQDQINLIACWVDDGAQDN